MLIMWCYLNLTLLKELFIQKFIAKIVDISNDIFYHCIYIKNNIMFTLIIYLEEINESYNRYP